LIPRQKTKPPVQVDIPNHIHTGAQKESKLYSAQEGPLRISARLGSDKMSKDDMKAYFMLSLEGEDGEVRQQERLPLHLALVLDRSGSMSGEKLAYLKEALYDIADQLDERDHVSLVVYDDRVDVVYDAQFDRRSFVSVVSAIESGGSTYLEGGLEKGMERVTQSVFQQETNAIRRVILLSDGLANVGIQDPDGLARLVEREGEANVTVSTIGVGADYDERIMTEVAIAGDGNYYFMKHPNQAGEIFAQEFSSMFQMVARNIDVELETHRAFAIAGAVGYHGLQSDNTFSPQDISAGRTSTYLFEIQVASSAFPFPTEEDDFVTVNVSYTDVISNTNQEVSIPMRIQFTEHEVNPLADNTVYEEYMNAYMAEQLWQVDSHLEQVENEKARGIIDTVMQDMGYANSRLNSAFDEEIERLEEKKQFLDSYAESDVQDSETGRLFKKSNQAESFERQYSK
jgi:Ca-activated chloride channel family protein